MKWRDAFAKVSRSDCDSAVAVTKKNEEIPLPGTDSMVACKEKLRQGKDKIPCDSDCPKGNKRGWW